MNSLISVIVPVYNIREYLPQCLDSILAQSYSCIEVVCVDDGSSDGSGTVLDDYSLRDDRVRVIHKGNGGVTSARLRGVAEAKGEWIGFVDGDDFIEPDMYSRLMDNAKKSGADLSHCGYRMVFPDRVDYYYNTKRVAQQSSREALLELLGGSFEPGLCNKLFRKELFDEILRGKLVDPKIKNNEDLLMNYYLFRSAKKSVFEDFCPYHYQVRRNSAATSRNNISRLSDPERVYQRLLSETENDPELNTLCMESLIRHLIRCSTMKKSGKSHETVDYITHARVELKKRIPELRKNGRFSKKTKLLSQWASTWPESYRLVHHIYGELTGVNHKYDV